MVEYIGRTKVIRQGERNDYHNRMLGNGDYRVLWVSWIIGNKPAIGDEEPNYQTPRGCEVTITIGCVIAVWAGYFALRQIWDDIKYL